MRRVKRETSGVSVVSGGLKRTTTQIRSDKKRKGKRNIVLWSAGVLLVAAICAIIFWPQIQESN